MRGKILFTFIFAVMIFSTITQAQQLERIYYRINHPVVNAKSGEITIDIDFWVNGAFFAIIPNEGVKIEITPDKNSISGKDEDDNLFVFTFSPNKNVSCQLKLTGDLTNDSPLFIFHLFEVIEENCDGIPFSLSLEKKEIYDPKIVMVSYKDGLKEIYGRNIQEFRFGVVYFSFPELQVEDISTNEINVVEIPHLKRNGEIIPNEFEFTGNSLSKKKYTGPLFRFYDPDEGPILHNIIEGYWMGSFE